MTTSAVSICNSALIKLGCERISSLTEDNKRARLCDEQFEKIRDLVLRSHTWNFAIKRVELAALTSTPTFEWSFEYNLPTDYLASIEVYPNRPYAIENFKILSDSEIVKLKYIYKCVDYYKYDTSFVEALALRLAADLAYPLIQSTQREQELLSVYEKYVADARSRSSQEKTPEKNIGDTFLNARYAGPDHDDVPFDWRNV
jgi:hypothetical protein